MAKSVYSKATKSRAPVAAVLLSLALAACATTAPPSPQASSFQASGRAGLPAASTVLAAGAPVTAPDGFLNLCMRSPTDCAVEDSFSERVRVVAEARELSRQRWRAVFSARFASLGAEPPVLASAPAATDPAALANVADTRPASIGPAFTTSAAQAFAPQDVDAAVVTPSVPPLLPSLDLAVVATPAETPVGVATLDKPTWSALKAVNREVNRKIRKASDRDVFGVEDWWAAPLSQGGEKRGAAQGDCEDYVLEKRRALIARGVPAQALSIALARTSWGEPHAVLLVATDRGDYVLDNLSSTVKPWRELDYVWTARQSSANLLSWVSLEAAGL